MKKIKSKVIYSKSSYNHYLKKKDLKKTKKIYPSILRRIIKDINSPNNLFYSFNKNFKLNFSTSSLSKFKKFKTVVVVGMGGSILGSEAIYNFLKKKIKKKYIFLNNIDNQIIQNIKKTEKLNKILFIIISKSGKTVETLSNLISLNILKNKANNIIIISEKKENPLYLIAKKLNLFFIEHRKYIGGRYSVFSEAGVVPAILMGLNILKIKKNLHIYFNLTNKEYLKKSTIELANYLKKKNFSNIVFLNYVPELNKFLFWLQQLMAESLGKKGKGFLPTISEMPKDHHSLLQLYLGGPKDKIFYIFSSKINKYKKINSKVLGNDLKFLNNKSLETIKSSQKDALIHSFKKNKIAYKEFKLSGINEEVIGELFSYFMLETFITAKLANINPLDQPEVEQIKITTKKILS